MKKRVRLSEGQLYRLIEQAVCGMLNDSDDSSMHNKHPRSDNRKNRSREPQKSREYTDFVANGYGSRPSVDVNGYGSGPSVDVNGYFTQKQANRMAESIIRKIKFNNF